MFYAEDDLDPLFDRDELIGANFCYRTSSLFWEHRHDNGTGKELIYNLKEVEWKGTISMKNIYMACKTEYQAAMKLLGSWPHWKELSQCEWFKPHLEAWQTEREVRDAAIGKAVLITEAIAGNVSAARALHTEYKRAPGRPTKAEKAKEAHRSQDLTDFLADAAKRLDKGKGRLDS